MFKMLQVGRYFRRRKAAQSGMEDARIVSPVHYNTPD